MGRIRNVREDVDRAVTYKLLISRSSVRSRDGSQFKSMDYSLDRSPFLLLGSIWGSVFSEFSAKIMQPRLHNPHKYRPPSVPCPRRPPPLLIPAN